MKVVVETGGGSHTTSSASLQAFFASGPYQGQALYQQKQFQVGKAEWNTSKLNERWVVTEYDLPVGQVIELKGRGRTGNRGATKHAVHRQYVVDEGAEVIEEDLDVGLRTCLLKGRLRLLRDIEAEREGISLSEGF